MKLKKKTSITKLMMTDECKQVLNVLCKIVVLIIFTLLCIGVNAVSNYLSMKAKKMLLILSLIVLFVIIVILISIEIKRKIVGLVLSSRLPLSEQEIVECNATTFTEYLSFLNKYLGNNTLYISQEQFEFMNYLCIKEKDLPLFLITKDFINDESIRRYMSKFDHSRFTIYNLEAASKTCKSLDAAYSRNIPSCALSIKNAKISDNALHTRCLQVIDSVEDYFRDNLQILEVINRQDYKILGDNNIVRRIVKSKEIE